MWCHFCCLHYIFAQRVFCSLSIIFIEFYNDKLKNVVHFIIKYTIFSVCTSSDHVMDVAYGCVCGLDFYQTGYDDYHVPYCTPCPMGSTTDSHINAQDISGNYSPLFFTLRQTIILRSSVL